jgi:butyrate kinase
MNPRILVINPGSTSTKIALYHGARSLFETTLRHERALLEKCDGVMKQDALREAAVREELSKRNMSISEIKIFMGRGGLLRPIPGGTYAINQKMINDLASCSFGEHASNLGAIIASRLAKEAKGKAYIANPVVVDELSDVARISGHPAMPRRSIFHALSQKAVAQKAAAKLGKKYEKCNLIVAHIGGGITVGAHEKGRVVEVNNGLEGDGSFTPERTGGVTVMDFYRYALAHKLDENQAVSLVSRNGGLLAHLGTNDCRVIEEKIRRGNKKFALVYAAFAYNVAKNIGSCAAALAGKVDAVVLTGEVLYGEIFRKELTRRVKWIAPVQVFLKNSEMEALASAGLEVASGKNKASNY